MNGERFITTMTTKVGQLTHEQTMELERVLEPVWRRVADRTGYGGQGAYAMYWITELDRARKPLSEGEEWLVSSDGVATSMLVTLMKDMDFCTAHATLVRCGGESLRAHPLFADINGAWM